MASGKIFGSEEDSRSCESGWTMYLASHSHDPDDDCYFDDGDDEDSDGGDSMDSDASSGPMESALNLKLPQEVHEEQNSIQKKKKSNEEMVSVETRVHSKNYDDDDDDENDDYYDHDDGNDSYSAVHSYVGAVRQGFV